jgi:hypothetical protein
MRRLLLTAFFGCLASNAFAGDVGAFFGLPWNYGTSHYSIWYGRLPAGIVPLRVCLYRYVTPGGQVFFVRKVCHTSVRHHPKHRIRRHKPVVAG